MSGEIRADLRQHIDHDAYQRCVATYEDWRRASSRLDVERARDDYADTLEPMVGVPAADIAQWLTDTGIDGASPDIAIAALRPRVHLRQSIIEAIARSGRTRTELAATLARDGVCNAETVMRFLRGDTDASSAIVDELLTELGLRVM